MGGATNESVLFNFIIMTLCFPGFYAQIKLLCNVYFAYLSSNVLQICLNQALSYTLHFNRIEEEVSGWVGDQDYGGKCGVAVVERRLFGNQIVELSTDIIQLKPIGL